MYPRSAALAAACLLSACGDNRAAPAPDDGMPPDSGLDEDGCRILTLGQKDFQFNLIEQILGVRFPVTPNLEGNDDDFLRVELWDSTTPGLPPLATGTFDLSLTPDLATCQHCVWVELDAKDDGTVGAIYIATEGSITVTKVTDPLDLEFAGSTSRVVMRRATVGENGATTLVPEGDCVSITGSSFDTTPTPGAACESAEDCGNPLVEICDPSTNTCTPPECNFDSPCTGPNELCLVQYRDLFDGACYTVCDPSAGSPQCPDTQQCAQRGLDPTFGICKYTGTGAVGDTCTVEDNSTSCSDGVVCSDLSETCAATCSFFAADSGCSPTTACSLFSQCEPPSVGIDVAFGTPCGEDADLAQGCASDGESFRGICFAFEGDPLRCEKVCLGNQGCTTGEFCGQRFSSGLGICLPLPVCGDGVRGEINENCDDGNQNDNDGCSADCQTVDTDFLCDGATALAPGASVTATTATGVDGLQASCQPGLARARLFDVTPPAAGRLRLHLTSPSAQALSLRTTCVDAATETTCLGDLGMATDQELILQITDPTPAAISVMVSAMTFLEEDTFTLAAEFVAEDCGDGIVAGREVCDDSNETANDGCSADCRTIEYAALCTLAPALSTSAPNTGTLAGAPMLYEATCAADDGAAIHESRMFTFTAPAAGTLALKLTDDTSFAILTVRDGCGAPADAPELACRPAFLDGEIQRTLTAGETITAVVSTFFLGEDLGTFTLDATFTPQ
jgi:cysteine-rich repeat protein